MAQELFFAYLFMYLSYLFKDKCVHFWVMCDAGSISPLRVLCSVSGWRRQMAWACWDVDTKGVMENVSSLPVVNGKRRTCVFKRVDPCNGRRTIWQREKVTRRKMLAGSWSALRCFRKCIWNDSGNLRIQCISICL